ncbi:HARB1-like protein [Mya arenaria]|uniref:HARB1-like protein n=1 Tax=Mya arenaria TaxID=6604 RepID=A0ABY7ETJ3_MYAAR|nr:HARB1-like protein [Mya arenaria]
MVRPTSRSNPLPQLLNVLVTLQFLATGTHYMWLVFIGFHLRQYAGRIQVLLGFSLRLDAERSDIERMWKHFIELQAIIHVGNCFSILVNNLGKNAVFTKSVCKMRLRLHETSLGLERLIGHKLERPTRRNQPLTSRQQIMIALRFYATGIFLQVIGDTFGVDVATVSRTARFVFRRHRHRTKTGFNAIRGFPSVISAVDGTHVRIQTPSMDEEQYVNRKHFHSINVQASCDHRAN